MTLFYFTGLYCEGHHTFLKIHEFYIVVITKLVTLIGFSNDLLTIFVLTVFLCFHTYIIRNIGFQVKDGKRKGGNNLRFLIVYFYHFRKGVSSYNI